MSVAPGPAKVVAAKAEMRRLAQGNRKAAWETWVGLGIQAAGQALASRVDQVLGAASHRPQIATAYVPMRTELDPLPLLSALSMSGLTTALPVVAGKGRPLLFRRWCPGDSTVAAGFDTREPPSENPEVEPDLLLVPLLAFDRRGYRLGYGGGFYDRTLEQLRTRLPAVTALGVAFDAQEVDGVPHLDYDQRLDGVLTPSGLLLIAG
jgi:5-formyltetrahydrofolate cyclo-ligase